jgi:hypothetical protein
MLAHVKTEKREGGQHVEHAKTRRYASILFKKTPGETRRDERTKRKRRKEGVKIPRRNLS